MQSSGGENCCHSRYQILGDQHSFISASRDTQVVQDIECVPEGTPIQTLVDMVVERFVLCMWVGFAFAPPRGFPKQGGGGGLQPSGCSVPKRAGYQGSM